MQYVHHQGSRASLAVLVFNKNWFNHPLYREILVSITHSYSGLWLSHLQCIIKLSYFTYSHYPSFSRHGLENPVVKQVDYSVLLYRSVKLKKQCPLGNDLLLINSIKWVSRVCSQESPRKRVGVTDDGPGRLPEVKAIQQTRRLLANARERTRVHTISAAFEALRKQVRLPVCDWKLTLYIYIYCTE